ncbi:MAG: 2-hydroxyacyl-CoA dehydratase, partial [Clostridiales bacterium]|nr:2-hydroxyacyl-CoA dehydratase [Clostridiales bacterium]
DEIKDLLAVVEETTGNKVTAESLAEWIKVINLKRAALERLYNLRKNDNSPISGTDSLLISQIAYYDDPKRFTQMLNVLCDELETRVSNDVNVAPGAKRIIISGTPMAIPNWKMHNIVETSGAVVVCEETCTGTRYFENYVDESGKTIDEMIHNIADRYMKINCACFTPNEGRFDDLIRLAKEYKADGVIDVNLKFCQTYDIEGYTLEQRLNEAGIKVLGLETDYTDTDTSQLKTRVEAFIETLD